MTLHLLFRSYGGENAKRRPAYYSKVLCLTSLVRAAAQVPGADVIFLNDGPIPADRLDLIQRSGSVRSLGDQAQGMRASYRAALQLAADSEWPDDDVVFFIEDDYLFTADALVSLQRAAEQLPEASYLTLYGDRPDYDDPTSRVVHSLPRHWQPAPDHQVGEQTWFNRASIASTFAARLGALRTDLPIFLACMGPFKKRYLDHETCLMYQGHVPYHGAELLLGLPEDFVLSPRGVVRAVALVPFRLRLNRLARANDRRHLLYALSPNLATHVEHPVISTDQDWEQVAVEVAQWAEQQGLAEPAARIHAVLQRAS